MKAEIKLNSKGVKQVLKHDSTRRAAEKRAKAIARAAGDGYEASSMIGRNRARASVITATARARRDDAKRGTLLRSAGAGRRG